MSSRSPWLKGYWIEMRAALLASLLIALVLTANGCSGARCPTLQFVDPDLALASHREGRAEVHSLRAEARVDQRGPEGRIRGTVLMFVERPSQVRFDAMTRFGPVAILTSDGEAFQLADLRENRFFEGPTCPSNIARLLGIRLSGADVTRFLLGDSPRIEAVEEEIACEGGEYHISLRAADGMRQRLVFGVLDESESGAPEDQLLELHSSELWGADGESLWLATFEDYRPVRDEGAEGGVASMPFRVQFFDRENDADTLVRFKDIDVNVEAPAGAFEQGPRPGLPTERVICD